MKKNLKINNKLKLNIGITKNWSFVNFPVQNSIQNQSSLKLFQNIQSLFLFSGRSINLYFRYYFFQIFFQRYFKLIFLKKYKLKFKYFFFFKSLLNRFKKKKIFFFLESLKKKKKKVYLSTFLNYFSSLHCNILSFTLEKNFLLVRLNVNLCFFSKKMFSSFQLYFSKKIIQNFLFLKFKKMLECKLQSLINFPVILNLLFFNQRNGFQKKIINLLQKKKYEKIKLTKFSNFWNLKTLHKIQKDIISNLLFGFYFLNAQMIADQFSLGLNRTRKQHQFLFWFDSLIKHYRFFGFNLASLKIFIFGKMAGKPRTKITKLHYGRFTVKTQTLALKVNYGYSTAETYTGSFGVHVWLYQRDSLILLNYLNYINQKLGIFS